MLIDIHDPNYPIRIKMDGKNLHVPQNIYLTDVQ